MMCSFLSETSRKVDIFSNILVTTEDDTKNYLGEKASKESRRVTDGEREEMDLEITLDDIEDTVKNLKK